MSDEPTKEQRGPLTVQIFETLEDGQEVGWGEGPCKSCEQQTEGDYETGNENDWWCSECWPYEEKRRLREELASLKSEYEQYKRWMDWRLGDDTGNSSLTIFTVMTGVRVRSTGIPYDSGDFGRCLRLLEAFPEWKTRLNEVAESFPRWTPIVDNWHRLKELYLARDDEGVRLLIETLTR